MRRRPLRGRCLAAFTVLLAGCTQRPTRGDAPPSDDVVSAEAGWGIDADLKLHLAFLSPTAPPNAPAECLERPPALGFTEGFRPDIDNITLTGILDLGFPLPHPEKTAGLSLFLKLFESPASFDAAASARRLLKDFLVYEMEAKVPVLDAFLSNRKRIAVKMAWIAATDTTWSVGQPFPGFVVNRCGETAQIDFEAQLPFFSLYLVPGGFWPQLAASDDDRAQWSTRGVQAFSAQLTTIYEKHLRELKGAEPDKYRYFVPSDWRCQPDQPDCTLVVWKLMRAPFLFKNWRTLPMPHDPKRIFLSALFLVYRYEYPVDGRILPGGASLADLDLVHFQAAAVPSMARVFEVGSVVRLP